MTKSTKAVRKYRNNPEQDRTWKTMSSDGKIMDFRVRLKAGIPNSYSLSVWFGLSENLCEPWFPYQKKRTDSHLHS